jgi:hypothetical protein
MGNNTQKNSVGYPQDDFVKAHPTKKAIFRGCLKY